jgi:hypothetical protein
MRNPRLTLDFKMLSDPLFENRSMFILASLTGNKAFLKPTPSLKLLDDAIKKYSADLVLAKDGGSRAVALKKQQRLAVTAILVELMGYVTFESKGDIIKMKSSGFTINASATSSVALGVVRNFKLMPGKNSGEVKGSFRKVVGGISFTYCYAPTPVINNGWTIIAGSTARFVLTGLQRGVEYAVRIGVIGAYGQTTYSETLTIMVV